MNDERRKYRRIALSQIIGVNVYKEKKMVKSLKIGGHSKDLSRCGLLFESKNRFPLHSLVKMEIDISMTPNVKMVSLVGEIVREEEVVKDKKYEYGICFTKVPQKDEIALEKFVSHFNEINTGKGFIDKKRTFLFHFFSESGMSYSERERGWFKIPRFRKRTILE